MGGLDPAPMEIWVDGPQHPLCRSHYLLHARVPGSAAHLHVVGQVDEMPAAISVRWDEVGVLDDRQASQVCSFEQAGPVVAAELPIELQQSTNNAAVWNPVSYTHL